MVETNTLTRYMVLEYHGPYEGGYSALILSSDSRPDSEVLQFAESETKLTGWDFHVKDRVNKKGQHVYILTREKGE